MALLIEVHKRDDCGNVLTLKQDLYICDMRIPCGFESDGCSVPEFLWGLLSPNIDSRTLCASIVHDFIYRTHPAGWTKQKADKLFRTMLIESGFPRLKAMLVYLGVVWLGSPSWNCHNGD